MQEFIKNGNRTKNITLDGSECEVIFDSTYTVFSVKADSEVTVALESGKAPGDDGVMVCPAGESIMYPHMQRLDRLYITGSGNVSVFASNEAVNPFKMSGKGGDVKPPDYIQDGLELMFALDGSDSDVLTNPVYVTDDTLGRVVGNVVNGQSSFYVNRTGWECVGADGVALQCLVKFSSLVSTNVMTVGYNDISPANAAFGLSSVDGKLAIGIINGSYTTNYVLREGIWYHLALVYDNTANKLKMYVNGSQVYVTDFYGSVAMSSYARGLTIGTWVWSSQYPVPSSANHGDFRVANCCYYAKALQKNEVAENFEVDRKRYGIEEM